MLKKGDRVTTNRGDGVITGVDTETYSIPLFRVVLDDGTPLAIIESKLIKIK